MKINRRKFLQFSAVAACGGASLLYISQNDQSQLLEVTETSIEHPNLPKEFNGYRIALLSDIHHGVFMSDDFLRKIAKATIEAKPDLVLLLGDFLGIPDSFPATIFSPERNPKFFGSRRPELVNMIYESLVNLLSDIEAPDGLLAICGNHDHWNDSQICAKVFSQSKFQLMINAEKTIKRNNASISLFGADDLWTGIPRLSKSFITYQANTFRVLMAHNPDFHYETLGTFGSVFDLGVSGHTHGGQIVIPGIGCPYGYNVRHEEFAYGLNKRLNSLVYTSRGLGVVEIPYRVNCRPELTILSLKA
jgi:uncharacterized protein